MHVHIVTYDPVAAGTPPMQQTDRRLIGGEEQSLEPNSPMKHTQVNGKMRYIGSDLLCDPVSMWCRKPTEIEQSVRA